MATSALCPTITTLNGLPVSILLEATLTELNLSGEKLSDVEAYLLSHLLQPCKAITTVNLSHNKFKNKAIEKMAPTLCGFDDLKFLDLSHNLIFKTGGNIVADILRKCPGMEVLLLNGCELTNAQDVSLIIRKSKEDKEAIIPDQVSFFGMCLCVCGDLISDVTLKIQSAVKKIRDTLATHKSLIELDLEDNEVDSFIMLGIRNRLKVNCALRHSKSDFDTYVDKKFDLSSLILSRPKHDHTTNVTVDYDYFPRERIPKVAALISEGEGAIAMRTRLEKERLEVIRLEREKEAKKMEEKRKAQMERELQGTFEEEDHMVEPEENIPQANTTSLLAMSKFKVRLRSVIVGRGGGNRQF